MRINVLIADDHDAVREGLRTLLSAAAGIAVIGTASGGSEAVSEVLRLQPHVVLMDIAMPGMDGFEATRLLANNCPGSRVIMVSSHATIEHFRHAIRAGAWGYLVKESGVEEFERAIRRVHHGEQYLSESLAARLMGEPEPQGR
jgi:DNA-binding NarL/FixJ family response regulator